LGKLVRKAETIRADEAFEIVKKASIPDEYRIVAFEIVFSHLLSKLGGPTVDISLVEGKRQSSGSSNKLLTGRISELASEGFFNEPRTGGEIQTELKNRGYAYSFPTVGMALLALTRRRELRRILEKKGNRRQYLYTNP
jgi:hypothetical protein